MKKNPQFFCPKIHCLFLFFLVASSLQAQAPFSYAKPQLKLEWKWSQLGFEVRDPAFSPDGTRVVLVRKFHWADGAEAEGMPDSYFTLLDGRKTKEPRFSDPELILLKDHVLIAKGLGWGWHPIFTRDGGRVIYVEQVHPITGLRELAGTLKGNRVVSTEIKTKKSTVLAVPRQGYFSDPFMDPKGKSVFFYLNDAVNGDWGGSIGVEKVVLDSGKESVVLGPQKTFGLFHLIGPSVWLGENLVCRSLVPQSKGTFTADRYQGNLLNLTHGNKSVYSFGVQDLGGFPNFWPQYDGYLYIDGIAHSLKLGNVEPITTISNPFEDKVYPSPNGNHYVVVRNEHLFAGIFGQQGEAEYNFGDAEFRELVWSPDSKKIALVVAKFDKEYFEELMVLSFKGTEN